MQAKIANKISMASHRSDDEKNREYDSIMLIETENKKK